MTQSASVLSAPHGADWHREHIKAELRINGTCLTELAEQHGYDSSSFSRALVRPWPAVERIIAKAMRRRPQDVWPSRYDSLGKSLSGRRSKRSARTNPSHRQIGGAP